MVAKIRSRAPSPAVLFLQQLPEEEKGHGGLCGVPRFGDDVDGKVFVPHVLQQLRQGIRGKGVAGEKDLGGLFAEEVIVGRGEQLQHGPAPR